MKNKEKKNKYKNTLPALFIIGFVLFFSTPVLAETSFTPQIAIPNLKIVSTDFTQGTAIGKYIQGIYNYSVGIVGILAAVVMMWGGVRWITAGGNAEAVTDAKSWITASLTGLVLVMCSYLILHTVNPDLTYFRPIVIQKIANTPTQNCTWYNNRSNCSELNREPGNCTDKKPNGETVCCCNEIQAPKSQEGCCNIYQIISNAGSGSYNPNIITSCFPINESSKTTSCETAFNRKFSNTECSCN